ncbi:MAG: glycoside hydrolase family 24 [Rhizobiales bacterium]|nr:glycoside hydrolase family 24 [Hyphomicrobiales bacterium]
MTQGFHEVSLPLRLALGAAGGPARRTDIVALSNGGEARNARWADSRRRYDVGTGLRSIEDLYQLTAFFEARRGQLYGFRFRDPVDHASAAPGTAIAPTDQEIGTGDGETAVFQLRKLYGETVRIIHKPVAGSVLLAVDGVAIEAVDFEVDDTTGEVSFAPAAIPGAGAVITAGYEFDIPVRFDADRIEVNLAAFRAGSAPTVPLVEIRP